MLNKSESKKKGFRFLGLPLFVMMVSLSLMQSCSYRQKHVLFQSEKKLIKKGFTLIHVPDDANRPPQPDRYQHRIKVGDRISVKFLNNYDISTGITIAGGSTEEVTFLVDANGEVVLPMVGRVSVAGMTRKEVSVELEKHYSSAFKEPRIDVQVVGMKVSILGEVENPGVYGIEDEDVDIVNVIARAGGITPSGKTNSVRLVRNFADVDSSVVFVLDLTNVDILNENELILHDNDIIVVEPTNIRVVTLAIQPYTGLLTVFSTVATMAVLLIQIVRPAPTSN